MHIRCRILCAPEFASKCGAESDGLKGVAPFATTLLAASHCVSVPNSISDESRTSPRMNSSSEKAHQISLRGSRRNLPWLARRRIPPASALCRLAAPPSPARAAVEWNRPVKGPRFPRMASAVDWDVLDPALHLPCMGGTKDDAIVVRRIAPRKVALFRP
jgi:hypothetical protein